MTDTHGTRPETDNAGAAGAPEREGLSVARVRDWLRAQVAELTDTPVSEVAADRPLEEFGLASRDAVGLSGELEDFTGLRLDATVVYEYPSIDALARYVVEVSGRGAPSGVDDAATSADGVRTMPPRRPLGSHEDVAIVGLALRTPGGVRTPEQWWDLLDGGSCVVGDLPEGRWQEFSADPVFAEAIERVSSTGGYLDDDTIRGFDPEFFAMSPREVEMVDPQQRMMLELTWEALEHAHLPAHQLRGERVGVFVGASSHDYSLLIASDPETAHPYAVTGNSPAVIANRVSYTFDFRGPSVTVDTACSASLVAVHQAVAALRAGEADVAIAGGINLLLAPVAQVGFGDLEGVLSPDGRIKAFSDDADGISRAEAAGVVVLKRLSDAEAEGDDILAVIKGSAVNQDGRSNGLTAPNPAAQADVLRRAYADAGIDPRDVDYVEAHGTGTVLGDPIEAGALGQVVGHGREDDRPLLIGSAKTNIGHSESAAGIVGLAKVVLAISHDRLPQSLNFTSPNRFIDFERAHLAPVTEQREWPRYSGAALAGVSGFGFGGTNAHVVVAEYAGAEEESDQYHGDAATDTGTNSATRTAATGTAVVTEPTAEAPQDGPDTRPAVLLPVSAPMASRCRRAAGTLAEWLAAPTGRPAHEQDLDLLVDTARTLGTRDEARARSVVLAHTRDEATARLRAAADNDAAPGLWTSGTPAAEGPVWVFSGFGAQHRKMGKTLYLADRDERRVGGVFAEALERVCALVLDESGHDLLEVILDDAQTYSTELAQDGIFALQVALVDFFHHLGARPAAVIGHSMGEVAAAYAAGGLELAEAVRVICARSRLLGEGEEQLSAPEEQGAMGLVEYSAADLERLVAENPEVFDGVEPAVYAAPQHTTVAGPRRSVEAFVAWAEEQGKMARLLKVNGAGHSSMVDPLLGELAAELAGLDARPLTTTLFSSVHRDTVYRPGETIHMPDYFVHGMRHAVWFTQAVEQAVDAGHTTFVEFAPNPVALMSVAATVYGAGVTDPVLVHTLKRKEYEPESVLAAAAQMWTAGHDIDLSRLLPEAPRRRGRRTGLAELPRTRFERRPFWAPSQPGGPAARRRARAAAGAVGAGALGLGAGIVDEIPGARVALPDGSIAFGTDASAVASPEQLITAAAEHELTGVTVEALRHLSVLPPAGEVTTVLRPHPGGAGIIVYARPATDGDGTDGVIGAPGTDLLRIAEASVRGESPRDGASSPAAGNAAGSAVGAADSAGAVAAVGAAGARNAQDAGDAHNTSVHGTTADEEDSGLWSPASGETVLDRLRAIIAAAMGYATEDLPVEVPLIELGLDSLMAVRIKNRVEHDFQIPELELQAVRDASLRDVTGYVQYALDHRDEVTALAAEQDRARAEGREVPEAAAGVVAAGTAGAAPATDSTGDPTATPVDTPTGPETLGGDPGVPPRDAAERLAYGTWALVTGETAGGIFDRLPSIDAATVERVRERLIDRLDAPVADDVVGEPTIARMADRLRPLLETEVEGLIRNLRPRPEGVTPEEAPALFLFHPAGGSTAQYRDLVERLPRHLPIYGIERVEGSLEERVAEYLPVLREIQGSGPYLLAGWSFGGALAYEVAHQLHSAGDEVGLIALLDTVQPSEPVPDTVDELHARWERYAAFASKTYGFDFDVPHELLEHSGEDGMLAMIGQMMEGANLAEFGISPAVLEHQRASFVDNRILQNAHLERWADVTAPVVLYRAERMHDGAIELEPRYAHINPDGGWGAIVADLDIVHLPGDHLGIVDVPVVSTVAADLARRVAPFLKVEE